MSKQKQVNEGGNATLSVKVSQETYELLNILAEGMEHGTNANDLLKMFVQAFIESAKHTGPISSEMSLLLDMLKVDAGWNQAFNFADLKTQKQVAQVILILEQPGREGFGAVMINRPFIPGKKPYMTYCVDEILERATEVTMKGLYQELRDIGNDLGTESMRETLFTLCDAYKLTQGEATSRTKGHSWATTRTLVVPLSTASAPSARSTSVLMTSRRTSCSVMMTARLPTMRRKVLKERYGNMKNHQPT